MTCILCFHRVVSKGVRGHHVKRATTRGMRLPLELWIVWYVCLGMAWVDRLRACVAQAECLCYSCRFTGSLPQTCDALHTCLSFVVSPLTLSHTCPRTRPVQRGAALTLPRYMWRSRYMGAENWRAPSVFNSIGENAKAICCAADLLGVYMHIHMRECMLREHCTIHPHSYTAFIQHVWPAALPARTLVAKLCSRCRVAWRATMDFGEDIEAAAALLGGPPPPPIGGAGDSAMEMGVEFEQVVGLLGAGEQPGAAPAGFARQSPALLAFPKSVKHNMALRASRDGGRSKLEMLRQRRKPATLCSTTRWNKHYMHMHCRTCFRGCLAATSADFGRHRFIGSDLDVSRCGGR